MRIKLNPAQKKAVEHGDGPLLVLAGAGSGKTRVITQRVARLVNKGVKPETILAVSFTNKSAAEMQDRMIPLLGRERAERLVMSTFHSFGLSFVRDEAKALGLNRKFVIFDAGDGAGLVREIMREMVKKGGTRKLDPSAILARISHFKSKMIKPDEVRASDVEYDELARHIYPEYQARLSAMHAVDFDDLLLLPTRLLTENVEVRDKWRRKFEHLLVDEFQDTNHIQLKLAQLLTNQRGNICVVGDDDQSIYSWRGAEVDNVLSFARHFPGAEVVKLKSNYRSRAPILAVANAIIAQSPARRYDKQLEAVRGGGEPIALCVCADPDAEAQLIARELGALARKNVNWLDCAVLYRSNLQARPLEQELRAAGIPYRLFGGTQFFDRKEVKDAVAYLRLLINPNDEISLRRIINYPVRGLGVASVKRLEEFGVIRKLGLYQALTEANQVSGLPAHAKDSAARLVEILTKARRRLESGESVVEVARSIFSAVGLKDELIDAADGGQSGAIRWGNVQNLLRWLSKFEQSTAKKRRSLNDFLTSLTLHGTQDQAVEGRFVTLATLHAAKGLEFDNVFLIGCVEGQLPHSRTIDPKLTEVVPTDIEEERRLFYVGVTRARERLFISRPKQRTLRGKRVALAPSRFLEGLPEEHTTVHIPSGQEELSYEEVADMARGILDKLKNGAEPSKKLT